MYLPLFVGGSVLVTLCVLSSFAVILTRKRELFALLLLSFGCLVTVIVLRPFLTVPSDGLQFMIEIHTHLRFAFYLRKL